MWHINRRRNLEISMLPVYCVVMCVWGWSGLLHCIFPLYCAQSRGFGKYISVIID